MAIQNDYDKISDLEEDFSKQLHGTLSFINDDNICGAFCIKRYYRFFDLNYNKSLCKKCILLSLRYILNN